MTILQSSTPLPRPTIIAPPEWHAKPWLHDKPIVISHSSRGTLDSCPQMFEFYKFYQMPQRRPIADKYQMPGEIGHCLHTGYQEFMISRDMDKAVWKMMRRYPVHLDVTELKDEYTLEGCIAVLETMIRNVNLDVYEVAQIQCLDGVTRPAVEVEFEIWLDGILIGGRPVVYVGYIDLIVFQRLIKKYGTVDIKTTMRKEVDLNAEYKFHAQCLPYGIVLQHLSHDSVLDFSVVYLHVILDFLAPKVVPWPVDKTAQDVRDWYTELFIQMIELKRYYENGIYPRRKSGCNLFGRSPCRYLDICEYRNERKKLQAYLLAQGEMEQPKRAREPWIRLKLDMPRTA